ncbi:hypothetical protein FOA43_003317 [Brettanomyces nanus]|uniref:Arginine N-methyltransferase 2 n=1 Tax=Eeniella nana TaxID=13502 RepID=A0A875S2I3_EENNA|nr:uncharacterized protein FOA43_003317 [Brettanomyces nanus]QPG75931.1 hypothetical protein FOA43_003317 [Brettanomyces nanus]
MSELHNLCYLGERPITKENYLDKLRLLLKKGVPSTYTVEDAFAEEHGLKEAIKGSTTTPLHLICESLPKDTSREEEDIILTMIDELFLNGAGWCLTNEKDETPGCVLLRRGLHGSKYWQKMVDAGVRAELLFRRLDDDKIEFIDEIESEEIPQLVEADTIEGMDKEVAKNNAGLKEKTEVLDKDPTNTTSSYLKTKLAYKDGALVTNERCDGVMMQWEDILMKAGCNSLFKSIDDPKEVNILNIGFGMGIIDSMIQERNPTTHYICEAHPDVLQKMKEDGWMKKKNVVVLEGKWQDTVPPLLSRGIFFDGIYYDTYSEHYQDMLELFDMIVGLLKPTGTFSFFNGLGADRLICYEVYKKVVEIDLDIYGLSVKFNEIRPPENALRPAQEDDSVWKGIKRAYWKCPTYYHPEVSFA